MSSTYVSYAENVVGENGSLYAIQTGGLNRTLVDSANFHEIVAARGVPPMNPYFRDKSIYRTPMGTGFSHIYRGTPQNEGAQTWPRAYTNLSVTQALGSKNAYLDNFLDADAKAVRSFYENAQGSDVQALVSIGEFPKTMGLIASAATRTARTIRSLKKLDITEAFRQLGLETGRHQRQIVRGANSLKKGDPKSIKDFAANTWLELQYGWKPLLYEVEGAVSLLDKQWAHNSADLVIKGSGSEKFGINSYLPEPGCPQVPFQGYEGYASGSGIARVRYTCSFRVINPLLRNASSIGLTNLGSVVWELTPYSFVFDWFVPVGAWISAQTALHGLSFVQGCKSSTLKFKGQASLHQVTKDWVDYDVNLKCSTEREYFQRELLNGPPSSNIGLRPKDLDEALSFNKVITSLALLNNAR